MAKSYIYEEPSSVSLQDWLEFKTQMDKEVKRHPDRQDAIDALEFANSFIAGLDE